MTKGLSPLGFERKTFIEIHEDIRQALLGAFGEMNFSSDSVIGQLMGVFTVPASDLWELGEHVYNSQYIATAEGASLDKAVQLIGVTRLEATRSRVLASLSGVHGTAIPAGTQVRVAETGELFSNPLPGMIARSNALALHIGVRTLADETEYALVINGTPFQYESGIGATTGQIMSGLMTEINGGSLPIVASIDTGTGDLVITTTQNDLAFNGSMSSNLITNLVMSPVYFEAQEFGPVMVLPGTFTEIVTPLRGWASVTNLDDGIMGRARETDQELRVRARRSSRVAGAGSVEAIKAKLLQNVQDVSAVAVFENRQPYVVNGMPSHSFESIVVGGADSEIAMEIWLTKPAGIQTHGNTCVLIEDSNGDQQQICFSRPVPKYIWVKVEVDAISGVFPSNGLSAIADQVMLASEMFSVGDTIIYQEFFGPIYEVQGIYEIILSLGVSDNPETPPVSYASENLTIESAQIGMFDLNRVSVTFV